MGIKYIFLKKNNKIGYMKKIYFFRKMDFIYITRIIIGISYNLFIWIYLFNIEYILAILWEVLVQN